MLSLCLFVSVFVVAAANIVETEYGPVRGYTLDADLGKKYISFLNVPYSKQPIGDLRFMPLVEPDPWTEVYNARNETPMCLQKLKFASPKYLQNGPMNEACLGANVYVPAEREGPLPVLVFIHGSAFHFLSSSQEIMGPEYLVARDIIVVTVNLRLGIWGYLSLGTEYQPGNNGVKDAFFFMQWIQRNIGAFGGDPSKVTLGGQSAGGVITHYLTLYPPAEGLFRSVIMQSGNALTSLVAYDPDYATQLNTYLFSLLNITSTDTQEIFDILKATSNETLLEISNTLIDEYVFILFDPTIEVENENAIISGYPYDMMTTKKLIDVPQLIGYTTEECITLYNRFKHVDFASIIRSNPSVILPTYIGYNTTTDKLPEVIQLFNDQYFEKEDDDEQLLAHFMNLCKDSAFIDPTLRYAEFSAENKQSPTYLYQFSFNGENNLMSKAVGESPTPGAGHMDDINYLFKPHFYEKLSEAMKPGSIEELTKNRMVDMWANFVKTGNPTPEVTEEVPIYWPPTDASLTYLDINTELTIKSDPYCEVKEFYAQFYPQPTEN